jgi:hypothetical protein
MSPYRLALAAVLVLALAGCATKSRLTGVWVGERTSGGPLEHVIILAIDASETGRRNYEDAFAAVLAKRGVEGVAGYTVLPVADEIDEAALRAVVRMGGYDGAIVTRLVAVDETQTYVPPTEYASAGRGYGLYGYYGMGYSVQRTPGYMKTNTTVRLETHIYDAKTAVLIWAAHSDTFDPASPEAAIKSVTSLIAERLERDGLVPKD